MREHMESIDTTVHGAVAQLYPLESSQHLLSPRGQ
jgi:hypothetical protein